MTIPISIIKKSAFPIFYFNEKADTCILYEIWGGELCGVQKKASLGTQNKRQNWAIVSICYPREKGRQGARGRREDTLGRHGDRIISGGQEEEEKKKEQQQQVEDYRCLQEARITWRLIMLRLTFIRVNQL